MTNKQKATDLMHQTRMAVWRHMRNSDWKNQKENEGIYRTYSIGDAVNAVDPNHWSNKKQEDSGK